MYDILNDVSKFLPCNHDTSLANLTKFQRFIYYLKTKIALSDEIYSRIHPTSTTTPSLYGLPKLHKPGVPLRPILSCCGSYNHECARWLSQSLVNLRQHPTNTPGTFHFLTKLSSQNIKNHTIVSFDVKSLFTNIPTSFTTQLVLDNIFKNDCKKWNGLSRNRLKKLLTWSTTFQYDNKFYKQIDGVAMGSPIESLRADFIMNYLIDKALEIAPQLHRPSFFCRYMDDCFATFIEPTSINIFFNNLNSIHKQIQFTKEIESNNSLAFLDVLIEKSDFGINTSTYHKPTRTDLLLKYSSFSPNRYKRNLINNLLQRSFTICNSYLKIDSEFQSIKTTLMRNEYPSRFIDRCIRQFLNKKFSQHFKTQIQTCNHFTFKLPYLGNIYITSRRNCNNSSRNNF